MLAIGKENVSTGSQVGGKDEAVSMLPGELSFEVSVRMAVGGELE